MFHITAAWELSDFERMHVVQFKGGMKPAIIHIEIIKSIFNCTLHVHTTP